MIWNFVFIAEFEFFVLLNLKLMHKIMHASGWPSSWYIRICALSKDLRFTSIQFNGRKFVILMKTAGCKKYRNCVSLFIYILLNSGDYICGMTTMLISFRKIQNAPSTISHHSHSGANSHIFSNLQELRLRYTSIV